MKYQAFFSLESKKKRRCFKMLSAAVVIVSLKIKPHFSSHSSNFICLCVKIRYLLAPDKRGIQINICLISARKHVMGTH